MMAHAGLPRNSCSDAEQLFHRHLDLPKRIANAMCFRHQMWDDAHQFARLGLWRAARQWDPSHVPPGSDPVEFFRSYAANYIRWEISEGLRALDPLRRTDRARVRAVHAAYDHLAQRLQREPTWAELAAAAPGLHQAVAAERAAHPRSSDEMVIDLHDPHAVDPCAAAIHDDLRATLNAAVAALPPDLAVVIELRYWYRYTLDAIGEVLGITGSAVSQRETRALTQLRAALTATERIAA